MRSSCTIGQGIGNALSGLFGGVAGAGATVRTVVNVRAGGRTPLSGALHSVVLLAIVAGLGRYASFIPLASLGGACARGALRMCCVYACSVRCIAACHPRFVPSAGLLMKSGWDVLDWPYLRRLHQLPNTSVAVMVSSAAHRACCITLWSWHEQRRGSRLCSCNVGRDSCSC
jgi:sulfate permease, SulP family